MIYEPREASSIIKNGGILLYPADNFWVVGCDDRDDEAVQRLIQIMGASKEERVVLLESDRLLNACLEEVPELAWDIIDQSEEAISIVYPKGKNLASSVLMDAGSVAIRYVKSTHCAKLIQYANTAIISSPALSEGEGSPITFAAISKKLIEEVDDVYRPEHFELSGKNTAMIQLGYHGEIKIIRG